MARLSEQIRQIVKEAVDGGTSLHSVAKKISASPSLLTRFLAGECGLSLDKLDGLADVFGIGAVVLTQSLPPKVKRGRKAKEKNMPTATKTRASKAYWGLVAYASARDAFENNFSSHRGTYELTESPTTSGKAVCLYNNHPYHDLKDGESPKRNRETEQFRAFLKSAGIRELGYATYPASGHDEAGYSYAMILDATDDDVSAIHSAMAGILRDGRAACTSGGDE